MDQIYKQMSGPFREGTDVCPLPRGYRHLAPSVRVQMSVPFREGTDVCPLPQGYRHLAGTDIWPLP